MKLRILSARAAITALAVTMASLAGCNSAVPVTGPKADLAAVAVVQPQRKTLTYTIEEPGQVEGFEEAPLYSKLPAFVEKVNVDIGQPVNEGQVLAVLRIPELEREYEQKVAAVKQAEAAAEQAKAAVSVARAAVTSAKAKLSQARATIERTEADYQRWQSESARMADLADKRSVTRKAAEEAQDQLRAADAARKETASMVESAQAAVGESEAKEQAAVADEAGARAKVRLAEADQAHVKELLGYMQIKAPFQAVVTRRNVQKGYFVQPAEASGGKPLFVVARTDLLRAIAYVPEADAPFVTVGSRADIRVPAMGNKVFAEKIKRTSVALDSATRTLRVEADLQIEDRVWRPGLYIYVNLTIERPKALAVPTTAVFSDAGQSYCSVVIDRKVERRAVDIGVRNGGEVEVISGLKETDDLIAKDPSSFATGQVVQISAAPASPAPMASAAAEKK
jgi:RND family efflux transporter MFP subunit